MKIFIKTIVIIVCFTQAIVLAQTTKIDLNQKLPIDTHLIIGKLSNGLTYYIRANQKPEKRAIFYLAVNAGSVLETDDQVGLAHFTEHMGFNGTKQYPGNTLVDELEKKGIVFGREINAYTSFDETVYHVTLPTDDSVLFNMGLKILDGWAFGMLMTEKEIDKERGVIIEEWRTRVGAGNRLREKTLPIELKGAKYVDRLPIGTLENLQQFTYASIRNYYKTWYRSDNMALVVVGDFDPIRMEQMLKDFFEMNDASATPLYRPYNNIPDNKEPLIAIATDPETTQTQFAINYKQPASETVTIGDFRRNIIHSLFTTMLNARLSEISEQKTAPFQSAYTYYSSYWSRTSDAFTNRYVCKEGKGLEAFELALIELQRLAQHGFVASEFTRAKDEIINRFEQQAIEESKKESRSFASAYGANFLKNSPITSSKDYNTLAKILMEGISIEEVNQLIHQWIKDENITVNFTLPEKKGMKVPTEKQILALFEKSKNTQTTPYVDNANSLPFLVKEPKSGTVVKRTDNKEFGYTEVLLSNGAIVIMKQTDFNNDQIVFNASSYGGTSLYSDNKLVNASYAAGIIRECGIGNYNTNAYKKFMYGKNFSIYPWIGTLSEGISGNSNGKDFELFLQNLYMIFEAPRKDQNVLDKNIDSWRTNIKTQQSSPDFKFSLRAAHLKYPKDKRSIFALEEKHLSEMQIDEMYSIFTERFNNAADFTFYFVGNIDIENALPLIEKYIGGLPSTQKKETWIDRSSPFATGVINETVYAGIDEKSKFTISTCMPFEWNTKNLLAVSLLNNIIKIKLTEEIRENLGGTYGVGFGLSTQKLPQEKIYMNIQLGCEPSRIDELTNAIFNVIDEIAANGPTAIDLEKAQKQLCRAREVSIKNNNTWLSWLNNLYDYKEPLMTLDEYSAQINALTIEDLKKAAIYLKHDSYVRVVLMPENMQKK
ncbi:MAG: insulinase family protein [Bacteroidales bacterium]|nr:insulinase family protein [Bacteroidales bacterium]